MKINAAVLGASGYIGGEVVRLLLQHPHVKIACITAHEHADKRLDEVQPNLRGLSDLRFEKFDGQKADVTFLSLPHGEAMSVVPKLAGKIIDLSGDFRLADRAAFEKYYKMPHTAWDLRKDFVTGIPEIHRRRIREAARVAVGGCFATASILSNWPLVSQDLVAGPIIIDGKTGSSGSGAKPSEKTHHPFRALSFFGYEPFHHRHTPEIRQALGGHEVLFQPHSAPFVRGVFTTSYVPLKRAMTDDEVLAAFRKAYDGERFVRLGKGTTNVAHVANSNFIDIGVAAHASTAIVFGAIDNLIKGGAGQAVQCFNVMFGFEEDCGLRLVPGNP
ncbi:MAG: N-acetyl-gamma-glutamyl-phosphate reductase [Planctomycetes bacterium]|nr:N-acetyl-gamma-glutamyl-phosphate reductase [Planctomycetota bacterium]